MRNRLIDEYGSYKHMGFIGSNGNWRLVASESNGKIMDTLDTFKNDKAEYKTVKRIEIDRLIESGAIEILL